MSTWSEKLRQFSRYAPVGAWFFSVGSLIPLLLLAFNLDGAHGSWVFGSTIDDTTVTVPGLTYEGTLGALLLWTEIAVVAGANVATLCTQPWLRRIGLLFLTWWSVYWALGVFRISLADPGMFTIQALFLAVLCACTIHRQVTEWRGGARGPAGRGQREREASEDALESAINDAQRGATLYKSLETDPAEFDRSPLMRADVVGSSAMREVALNSGKPDFARSVKMRLEEAMKRVKASELARSPAVRAGVARTRRLTAAALQHVARAAEKGAGKLNPAVHDPRNIHNSDGPRM